MFTGLVEELGRVKQIEKTAKSVRLTIAAKKVLTDVKLGDSIAVNGACLTVVDFSTSHFTADVMPETVKQTGLRDLAIGAAVNLERTLRVGDRLGGHIVSGHIDGIGTIQNVKKDDIAVVVTITAAAEVMRYIVKKGSIAIDGVSLTVVDCDAHSFSVSLIPHTYEVTALATKKIGSTVNLETDILGRYVEKLLQSDTTEAVAEPSRISTALLGKYGFLA
ncbi:MAG: riboflavin synthase [Sporomusaceae bacterium]|nr:riboflavin synthase [Sporomusaceae bacterium]